MNTLTAEGVALIKRFEGFQPKPYKDPVGIPTIGYGHVIQPGENFTEITEEQASEMMLADIQAKHARWIAYYIHRLLNDNQYSALVSLVYNLGVTPLVETLGRKLNDGDISGASEEFPRWIHAGGKILPGLVKRRAAERQLFLKPIT